MSDNTILLIVAAVVGTIALVALVFFVERRRFARLIQSLAYLNPRTSARDHTFLIDIAGRQIVGRYGYCPATIRSPR
jgi:hypothetical protein